MPMISIVFFIIHLHQVLNSKDSKILSSSKNLVEVSEVEDDFSITETRVHDSKRKLKGSKEKHKRTRIESQTLSKELKVEEGVRYQIYFRLAKFFSLVINNTIRFYNLNIPHIKVDNDTNDIQNIKNINLLFSNTISQLRKVLCNFKYDLPPESYMFEEDFLEKVAYNLVEDIVKKNPLKRYKSGLNFCPIESKASLQTKMNIFCFMLKNSKTFSLELEMVLFLTFFLNDFTKDLENIEKQSNNGINNLLLNFCVYLKINNEGEILIKNSKFQETFTQIFEEIFSDFMAKKVLDYLTMTSTEMKDTTKNPYKINSNAIRYYELLLFLRPHYLDYDNYLKSFSSSHKDELSKCQNELFEYFDEYSGIFFY